MSDKPRIKREEYENDSAGRPESSDSTIVQQPLKAEPDGDEGNARTSTTRPFNPDRTVHGQLLAHERRPTAPQSSTLYDDGASSQRSTAGLPHFGYQPTDASRYSTATEHRHNGESAPNGHEFFGSHSPFALQPSPVYRSQDPQGFVSQHAVTGQKATPTTSYGPSVPSDATQPTELPTMAVDHQTVAQVGVGLPLGTTPSTEQLNFSSLEQATERVAARIKIVQVPEDDYDDALRDCKGWVLKLKNAFSASYKAKPGAVPRNREAEGAEAQWTAWQEKAYGELKKSLGPLTKTASEQVELACWKLFAEVIAVHRDGYRQSGYVVEQRMKCTERLQHIITGITECARVRVDTLNELHHHELAAAPMDYYGRKLSNLWVNYTKKLERRSSSAQGGGTRAQSFPDANAEGAEVGMGREHQSNGMAGVQEAESGAARSETPRRSFIIAHPNEIYDLTEESGMTIVKHETQDS
ncbi:hypothetical protein LTR85_009777 [Meristemomyces frigidus]|nr:hypothetical protein LTR85_009777 [Meristemomyces frigidus]